MCSEWLHEAALVIWYVAMSAFALWLLIGLTVWLTIRDYGKKENGETK